LRKVEDMKQFFRGAAVAGAALVVAVGSVTGCTEEETGFFIQGNVQITAPACVARAESGATLVGTGLLDVALKLDYEASLLVGNQLTPRGDKANLRTETQIATIAGAEVQLFRDTGELDIEFTVPASGVISPNGSEAPGFAVVFATLLPASTGDEISGEFEQEGAGRGAVKTRIARVKVFGETIGGLEIESSEFSYVIQVCRGCLVDFPAPALGPTGACDGGLTQNPDAPCRRGQDDPFDCRLCRGANPYCDRPGDL
jgi:hypothetical protein